MVKGFGRDCAAQLGLVGRSVDTGHDGPDLLDLLDGRVEGGPVENGPVEDDLAADGCDGWDRPADRDAPRW
jgi:hypothetical protein